MKGNEYADRIAGYLLRNFGPRGLVVYREVSLGKTIIGKNRRVDILALHEESGRALAIECKLQEVQGTADEKIPYALQDLAAMHIPAFVVYAGKGFSEGVLHLLEGSALAAYCLPPLTLEPTPGATTELDHIVAMTFGFWDAVLHKKKPFSLAALAPAGARVESKSGEGASEQKAVEALQAKPVIAVEAAGVTLPSPEPNS